MNGSNTMPDSLSAAAAGTSGLRRAGAARGAGLAGRGGWEPGKGWVGGGWVGVEPELAGVGRVWWLMEVRRAPSVRGGLADGRGAAGVSAQTARIQGTRLIPARAAVAARAVSAMGGSGVEGAAGGREWEGWEHEGESESGRTTRAGPTALAAACGRAHVLGATGLARGHDLLQKAAPANPTPLPARGLTRRRRPTRTPPLPPPPPPPPPPRSPLSAAPPPLLPPRPPAGPRPPAA